MPDLKIDTVYIETCKSSLQALNYEVERSHQDNMAQIEALEEYLVQQIA